MTKSNLKSIIASIAALGLTACVASATEASVSNDKAAGPIEKSDYRAKADERFEKVDANGDGNITEDEKKAAREARRAEMKSKRFDKMDSNQDGTISKDEYAAADKARGERRADRHKDGEGKRKHRKKAKRGDRPNADANGDGVVSKAEHDAMVDARFAKMDKNGDGVISDDEKRGRKHRGKSE